MVKKFVKRVFGVILPAFAPLFSKRSILDSNQARKILTDYSPNPMSKPISINSLNEPICDLQIIVPAYNVENYLEDCMTSILSQITKYTYKVVLIDDGSTDSTAAIADKYLSNDQVVVIHQKNKGFSGARNAGLKNLFGKYIMFVDSDDMLCPGAIEALLSAAFSHDCDIVEGGAFSLYEGKKRVYFSYPQTKMLSTALGTFHGQPWAKIFKATCFENIVFPEHFWFEDSIFSFLIYPVKQRVCVVDSFIYTYRINPNGISQTCKGKPKVIDTYWITELLMEIQEHMNIPTNEALFKKYLRQIVLNQKRISESPEQVQESAFVLSVELMYRYFSVCLIDAHKHVPLVRILSNKDWGKFKFHCKYS